VQTRLKESQITGAVADPTVRLVDAAAPPPRPLRPSLPVNLALSLMLGCLVGVTASLARDYGDRSVRSRADALAAARLPVLAAMPRVRNRGLKAMPWRRLPPHEAIASLLVTRPDTPTGYVESFNQLFANLALAYREKPLKVVMFTSPLPGEGKTLSAINFALIGASRGLRMLLIDADLRCGVVNSVLGCSRERGFAELLAGTAQAGEVLRQVSLGEHGSLMVIPSGTLPRVPGRVLNVERVEAVLGALAPKFDFVVIDTPPVNLLADAALLASAADAVLLVVRAGYTQRDSLRYAMDQLEAVRAPVLGTLLNDIDLRRNTRDDGAYRYIGDAERYHVLAG
jgi:capsular exopolysaccharide synthesis family protein